MKTRQQIESEELREKDKTILNDYYKRNKDGSWMFTVPEVAEKHGISVPLIYKIMQRNDYRGRKVK